MILGYILHYAFFVFLTTHILGIMWPVWFLPIIVSMVCTAFCDRSRGFYRFRVTFWSVIVTILMWFTLYLLWPLSSRLLMEGASELTSYGMFDLFEFAYSSKAWD